jgi:perosamine synthetase
MLSVPLFDCAIQPEAISAATVVLSSGQLASGPNVQALEGALEARLGPGMHVVAMGDMTHALTTALKLAGVSQNDEVLTISYNCLSSTSAITAAGARPVWVDIDPGSASISPADARLAITPRTKALVVYHVAGYPADLGMLRAVCDQYGLPLIEDANNALGASWRGQPAGTIGNFGIYSFYANRQLNGIEGAALVCRDAAHAAEARRIRRFGIEANSFRDSQGEIDPAGDVPRIGTSSVLNHLNATLALSHLDSLDQRLERNRANVEKLLSGLSALAGIQPVTWAAGVEPAFWVMLLRCNRRDSLLAYLKQHHVQCSKLHQTNDGYSGFGAHSRPLTGTRRFMSEVLAVPSGWWLDQAQIDKIIDVVRAGARLA